MSGLTHQTTLLHHLGDSCKTIEVLAADLEWTHHQISHTASSGPSTARVRSRFKRVFPVHPGAGSGAHRAKLPGQDKGAVRPQHR